MWGIKCVTVYREVAKQWGVHRKSDTIKKAWNTVKWNRKSDAFWWKNFSGQQSSVQICKQGEQLLIWSGIFIWRSERRNWRRNWVDYWHIFWCYQSLLSKGVMCGSSFWTSKLLLNTITLVFTVEYYIMCVCLSLCLPVCIITIGNASMCLG